jgi:hypothetical protein
MGKYQIRVEVFVEGSFDSKSDKLDVKGKKVNLTIWVCFLSMLAELYYNDLRISLWIGHCRRGALSCNHFLVLSRDTGYPSRLVIRH